MKYFGKIQDNKDLVTKEYVDTGLSGKQNTLTFDTTPTAGSTNPVTSGGVKSALDVRVLTPSAAFAIPASGSSVSYDLTGLTADHELVRWNFADSGTLIAENAPPVDLTWTTAAGYFTITNNGGTTTATIRPVFALPAAIAISAHS